MKDIRVQCAKVNIVAAILHKLFLTYACLALSKVKKCEFMHEIMAIFALFACTCTYWRYLLYSLVQYIMAIFALFAWYVHYGNIWSICLYMYVMSPISRIMYMYKQKTTVISPNNACHRFHCSHHSIVIPLGYLYNDSL